MLFKRISAAILCAVAMSLAAPDADSGEDMMIFKAILQSPIFKDNFVQSCTAQSMEWLGASQADKTCNCAFDRMVKDSKFINVIRQFLKAGYIEDWDYHKTYSGTPQGGILSPILANIYLNELDNKIMEIKESFKQPHQRKYTYEYSVMKGRRDYQKAKLRKLLTICSPALSWASILRHVHRSREDGNSKCRCYRWRRRMCASCSG